MNTSMNAALRAVVELGLKGDERAVMLYVSDHCDVNDACWLIPEQVSKETGISNYRRNETPQLPSEVERVIDRLCVRGVLVEIGRTARKEGWTEILYRAEFPRTEVRPSNRTFATTQCPACGTEVVYPTDVCETSVRCQCGVYLRVGQSTRPPVDHPLRNILTCSDCGYSAAYPDDARGRSIACWYCDTVATP